MNFDPMVEQSLADVGGALGEEGATATNRLNPSIMVSTYLNGVICLENGPTKSKYTTSLECGSPWGCGRRP